MAPSSLIVVAFFRLASATSDEQSMLQMPVVDKSVETDASDCRCPGYYEEQCNDNAYQGCMWTDDGDSDSHWCKCDPNFEGRFSDWEPPLPPLLRSARVLSSSSNDCGSCGECEANTNSPPQAVTDPQCAPCANDGQPWWPCLTSGMCRCKDGSTPVTPAPTTTTPSPGGGDTDGGAGNGRCTAGPADCSFDEGAGISSWFTLALFNEMFPNLCSSSCHGCEMLTYNCMIKATLEYPDMANSGDVDDDKREIAAWMGIMGQETTGGGCSADTVLADGTCSCGSDWCDSHPNGGCSGWGLCFVEEAGGTYCTANSVYPCVAGQEYRGRGPKQLSYNYNYGQFSAEYCGDKNILLNNPGWVASNPTLAWASSLWFWFSGGACLPGESCKPAPHGVFTGSKTMCTADVSAGRKYGLGWATNIVNGGLECPGAGRCDRRVHSRVRFYKHYCDVLGVSPYKTGWDDDNLFCSDQLNYIASAPTEC